MQGSNIVTMWGAFVLCLLFAATTHICADFRDRWLREKCPECSRYFRALWCLEWDNKVVKVDGEYLSHSWFADHITVFAENTQDQDTMLRELCREKKNYCSFSIVNFTLSLQNKVSSCDATKERGYRVTAVEGQPLQIIVNYNYTNMLNRVTCTCQKNTELLNENNKPAPANFTTRPVAADMRGVLNCTILTHQGVPGLTPIFKDSRGSFVMANCYLQLDVRRKETPLSVRVNNLILRPTVSPYDISEYDYSVEYRYMNNDEVDIWCFQNITKECTLELEYDHVKDLYKDVINLLVNNHPTRIATDPGTCNQVNPTYEFFQNEPFHVICYPNIDCSETCSGMPNSKCNFTLSNIKSECKLYFMKGKCVDVKINNITIVKPQLSLAYSKNNTAMDIYAPGGLQISERLIYYEFDKNQNDLTVRCSLPVDSIRVLNILTSDAENTETKDGNKIASLKFPHIENFQFNLTESVTNYPHNTTRTKEIVTLVFIPKIIENIHKQNAGEGASTENGLTTTDESLTNGLITENKEIYIGVAVIMVIILVCLAFVFYKLTKKNQAFQTQSMVAINDEVYSETQIPPHPPQWTEDVYERSEYSVPFGQPDTYATPIPKHLRHLQRDNNSEVYAEVYGNKQENDLPPYAKVSKPYKKQDEEISPYAEVGNKAGYSEISPYAEIGNKAEYSEISPYAEIGNKGGYSEISPYAEIGNKEGYSEISPYAEIGNKGGYSEISPYAQVVHKSKIEKSPYAEIKELYSQVQPKSLRHNKDSSSTSYVNNFPDSPYENAGRTEYVEPTYTETLRK